MDSEDGVVWGVEIPSLEWSCTIFLEETQTQIHLKYYVETGVPW
jgi:hypothetical protein